MLPELDTSLRDFIINHVISASVTREADSWQHIAADLESQEELSAFDSLTLSSLLASAAIIRPILADQHVLQTTHLFRPTGGPDYNMHRTIDALGAVVFRHLVGNSLLKHKLQFRIEEEGAWNSLSTSPPFTHLAVFDPIDETSRIKDKKPLQSTGLVIFDTSGNFVSGGIASLIDQTIVLCTTRETRLYQLDQTTRTLKRKDFPTPTQPQGISLRYAMLKRRRNSQNFPLPATFREREPDMDTFGGIGILQMASDHIDAMIDPVKGQPWYEAIIWGAIAKQLGYRVVDPDGNDIDLQQIILAHRPGVPVQTETDDTRVPIIIAKNTIIMQQILNMIHDDGLPFCV